MSTTQKTIWKVTQRLKTKTMHGDIMSNPLLIRILKTFHNKKTTMPILYFAAVRDDKSITVSDFTSTLIFNGPHTLEPGLYSPMSLIPAQPSSGTIADYPAEVSNRKGPATRTVTIENRHLKRAIDHASTDQCRIVLNSILLDTNYNLISSDGKRMFMTCRGKKLDKEHALLPLDGAIKLNKILTLMGEDKCTVHIDDVNKQAHALVGKGIEVLINLVDMEYPELKHVLKKKLATVAQIVPGKTSIDMLKQWIKATPKKDRNDVRHVPVTFQRRPDNELLMTHNGTDISLGKETRPFEKFGVDAQFLLDIFNSYEPLAIEFLGPLEVVGFRYPDDSISIVAPMRLEN